MCEKILLPEIKHLGANDCVTGSCHLVQIKDGVNILVHCGKGYGHDPEIPFDRFPVLPRDIDYRFLTHAHIDHIGRVPDLFDAEFQGGVIGMIVPALLRFLKRLLAFLAVGRGGTGKYSKMNLASE